MLLNSLKLRTFAEALKILLCCETFLKGFFAKLNTSAPTQLGKKKKQNTWIVLFVYFHNVVIGWADLSFFKGLLFIGGRNPSQALPQGLLVFQYGGRRHIGKRKDPGDEAAS